MELALALFVSIFYIYMFTLELFNIFLTGTNEIKQFPLTKRLFVFGKTINVF